MDMRTSTQVCNEWSVTADVESLAWDPHSEHSFVVSFLLYNVEYGCRTFETLNLGMRLVILLPILFLINLAHLVMKFSDCGFTTRNDLSFFTV